MRREREHTDASLGVLAGMSIDANTLSQFEMMIGALMSADNNVRGQAEASFNQAKTNPDILISALVHLLRRNESEQVSWWHRSRSRTAALPHREDVPYACRPARRCARCVQCSCVRP